MGLQTPNSMATSKPTHTMFTLLIILLLSIPTRTQQFSRILSKRESLGINKRRKISHLRFFFHDTSTGPHPTAFHIATASITKSSPTGFGTLVMMDDPLTVGPQPNSKIVGRAQGVYGAADMNNCGLLMVLNYVFLEGKFNGSTLSILGRNVILDTVREMPIVGGSGVFRFATDYAQAKTHTFNFTTADAVVEYNVYVLHY